MRTNGCGPTRATLRSWIHEPVVHVSVAAVSAMPPSAMLACRTEVTVNAT